MRLYHLHEVDIQNTELHLTRGDVPRSRGLWRFVSHQQLSHSSKIMHNSWKKRNNMAQIQPYGSSAAYTDTNDIIEKVYSKRLILE